MADAEEFLKNYRPVQVKTMDDLVEEDVPPMKILFVGDERVGKTTFIRSYCEHTSDHYSCETFRGTFNVFTQFLYYRERDGKRIPHRILDLPPGVTDESRRDQYPNGIDLVVLCFAVDNPSSFENTYRFWLPQSRRYAPAARGFCLLGLKCDRRLQMEAAGGAITVQRAEEIHDEFGLSGEYLECSVVANPRHSRHCMNILISYLIGNDVPGLVESP